MKHRFFSSLFTAMVGALAFTSCNNEVIDNTLATGKKQMTFTASYDKNISSRTTLGDDLSVLWVSDDVISVLDGTNNNDFTLSTGAGNSTAEFNGTASETSSYYAVYPYQSGATISGNVISGVVIPATQTATLNSFDPKANIMTAVSNSANNLAFKNVCSYAKITTTAACKKITFTAGATDKIAGTFDMIVGADGIASATATSGVNAVTLIPSSGTTFSAGTYYIAVNAGDMSALKVECEYTNKTVYQSINATISIFTRGSIIDLGSTDGWIEHTPQHVYEYGKGKEQAMAVDLGLPSGLKWSSVNLGATSPEDYGDYYAWGATVPWVEEYHINSSTKVASICSECTWDNEHISYDWVNTPYQTFNTTNKSSTLWTKYIFKDGDYTDPSATAADIIKTRLDSEDDAATFQWGGAWRIPTVLEYEELVFNTYWEWTNNYNGSKVKGWIVYKVHEGHEADKGFIFSGGYWKKVGSNSVNYDYQTGPEDFIGYNTSDTHIFFPAGGYCSSNSLSNSASIGSYWSSTLYTGYNTYAFTDPYSGRHLLFDDRYVRPTYQRERNYGLTIRPVRN